MTNIKDIDEVTVRKLCNGAYEVSSVYKGQYRHRQYIGYTKTKAKNAFKKALERGEI